MRGELHDAGLGVEGLDQDAPAVAEASAAPRELRQERKGALLAAEIGELQPLVGVERGGETKTPHIVTLRHHLRSHEDGAGLAGEALEHLLERTAPRRGVGVEAQHGHAGGHRRR